MIEFYPELRLVHIAAVIASGILFALRGLLKFAGTGWARAAPLRYLSYAIDCTLLTAAFMLMTILRQYPFAQSWLTVKVTLLIVYIGLGYAAFWKARTRAASMAYWAAALAVYAFIFSVARAHDPLGLFRDVLTGRSMPRSSAVVATPAVASANFATPATYPEPGIRPAGSDLGHH